MSKILSIVCKTNCLDPDLRLHYAVSNLGLHCLQRPICRNRVLKVHVCHLIWNYVLTHFSLEAHKRVTGKQCRPRSDAAECDTWSGTPLFANNLAIFLSKCSAGKFIHSNMGLWHIQTCFLSLFQVRFHGLANALFLDWGFWFILNA